MTTARWRAALAVLALVAGAAAVLTNLALFPLYSFNRDDSVYVAMARLLPRAGAVGFSAAVFGLWHIRPTLGALAANDLAGGPLARTGAVLLACLGTAAAGVLFAGLRQRSGSLLAPALLHLATNSLGLLAAAAAHR